MGMLACMYIHTCVDIHIFYVHRRAYVYTPVEYKYMCIYIYMYVLIYMIYTHIHTCTFFVTAIFRVFMAGAVELRVVEILLRPAYLVGLKGFI